MPGKTRIACASERKSRADWLFLQRSSKAWLAFRDISFALAARTFDEPAVQRTASVRLATVIVEKRIIIILFLKRSGQSLGSLFSEFLEVSTPVGDRLNGECLQCSAYHHVVMPGTKNVRSNGAEERLESFAGF